MRIAILGDIHSNLLGFNLGLEDLKKQEVDKIIYLGDYITDGEGANRIIQLVKKTADYAIVGNREKYILNYNPEKRDYINYKPILYTYNELNDESMKYIKSLEEYKIITLDNKKILLIHGDTLAQTCTSLLEAYDKIISDFDFDICLFAHSHMYTNEMYKGKLFVNPGSIGQPLDNPSYKYCILDLSNDCKVELREFKVSDSFREFEKEYIASNYYKSNIIWGNLILRSVKDGFDYCCPFIDEVNSIFSKIHNGGAEEYNKIYIEVYNKYYKDN